MFWLGQRIRSRGSEIAAWRRASAPPAERAVGRGGFGWRKTCT